MTAALLCLALPSAAAGPAAGPRTYSHLLGPVELVGIQHPMAGPSGGKTVEFPEDGWLTRLKAVIVDAEGRAADPSYLCHMTFHQPPVEAPRHDRLNLDEGMPDLTLPAGYGFPVRKGQRYHLDGMLQSDAADTDKKLSIRVEMQYVPRGADVPLKDLEHSVFSVQPDDGQAQRMKVSKAHGVWWVPAGEKRRYHSVFRSQSARVHFMMFHLHRYAREIAIEDADTGRVLYRADVAWDERNHLKPTPVYLSAEGLELREHTPYRLAVVYDNVSDAPIVAMASVHAYYHRLPETGQ